MTQQHLTYPTRSKGRLWQCAYAPITSSTDQKFFADKKSALAYYNGADLNQFTDTGYTNAYVLNQHRKYPVYKLIDKEHPSV